MSLRPLLPPLVLVGLAACHPPAWTRPEPVAGYVSDAGTELRASRDPGRPVPPPPRTPIGSVAARLEGLEGAADLLVDTESGRLHVERRGSRVVCSDGRSGPWLVVAPGVAEGVTIGDRYYLGRLVVTAPAGGGLSVVNQVPMEDYVRGVVARELAIWSAPPALLEAQAIAARSYAEAQLRGRPGKRPRTILSDSTQDQAYAGEFLPGESAGARAVADRLRQAVEITRGVVLVQSGHVLDARFHACCGGRTAAFGSVFPEPDPGSMTPVDCPPCRESAARARAASSGSTGDVSWEWTAESDDLRALAGALGIGRAVTRLFPVHRDEAGRWLEARVVGDRGGRNLGLTELRSHLGFDHLKSAWITSTDPRAGEPIHGRLAFAGRGRGHGVGFCQTGARELADRGWSARRILATYFTTATLSRLVPRAPAAAEH